MTRNNFLALLLLPLFSLLLIGPVSAQSIAILGEVRTNGKVFIESTGGQWISAPATYPLLQNTGIKTDDGRASLYFQEGSRIDFSTNSHALITGSSNHYSVTMGRGTLAFNMVPQASLSVITPTGSVSVNKKDSLVQKVSLETSGRVLGVISTTEKGTEVRSISGRITVEVSPTERKLISTGQSMFVDANSTYKVYNTQTLLPGGGSGGQNLLGGLILGAEGLAAGTLTVTQKVFASPSSP